MNFNFSKHFLLVVFLSSALVSNALAKPAPPAELTGLLGEFSELEMKFESKQWADALDTLDEVVKEFHEMLPELKESAGSMIVMKFDETLSQNLKKALQNKDESAAEKAYIYSQRILFKIMDAYEYKVHPVLLIMEKYISDEATEAAEKGAFYEVLSEMNELSSFFRQARPKLEQRGVSRSDMESFMQKVKMVKKASRAKDGPATKKNLAELEKLFKSFLN